MVVTTACNSGTSCIVNKKGELFVFGNDSSHADFSSGQVTILQCMSCVQWIKPVLFQVTDLSGQVVTQVGAGKAHIVVLTNNHEVFTFGMNNKGQCDREFPAGPGPVIGGGQLGNNDHEEADVDDHEAEHDMEIAAAAGQVILASNWSILSKYSLLIGQDS